jgi:hypothetical protein
MNNGNIRYRRRIKRLNGVYSVQDNVLIGLIGWTLQRV